MSSTTTKITDSSSGSSTITLNHPDLGPIRGNRPTSHPHLTQFLNLPYAHIDHRFARSTLRTSLVDDPGPSSRYDSGSGSGYGSGSDSRSGRSTIATDGSPRTHSRTRVEGSELKRSGADPPPYDATQPGPSSIQPYGSAKTDAGGLQLPIDGIADDEGNHQSETECLNLSITLPTTLVESRLPSDPWTKPTDTSALTSTIGLPVLLFLHGGAFFLGAGDRSYYNPIRFLTQAMYGKDHGGSNSWADPTAEPRSTIGADSNTEGASQASPMIFVAANYRLGPHGFFHSTATSTSSSGSGTSRSSQSNPPPDPSSEEGSGKEPLPDGESIDIQYALPENNGLHDQLRLFEWIQRFIPGFGGDPSNVTIIGQSAGAESVSLHNLISKNRSNPPYRRAIMFSGSPMCMPAKTREEHEANFRKQVEKMGIVATYPDKDHDKKTDKDGDGAGDGNGVQGEGIRNRPSGELVKDLMALPGDKIRDLGWVGTPCSQSNMMPYETPSMAILRGAPEKDSQVDKRRFGRWVPEQLVTDPDRKDRSHGSAFEAIARDVLGRMGKRELVKELMELYGIKRTGREKGPARAGSIPRHLNGETGNSQIVVNQEMELDEEENDRALIGICQFESDIGFFAPSLAECEGASAEVDVIEASCDFTRRSDNKRSNWQSGSHTSSGFKIDITQTSTSPITKSYLQIFELGNPFEGPLVTNQFATHTWDIVALLGAYEDRLSEEYKRVVRDWRDVMIRFVVEGGEGAGLVPWSGADACPACGPGSRSRSHSVGWVGKERSGVKKALLVDQTGVRTISEAEYLGEDTRRGKLMKLAKEVDEVNGADVLWNDVCRRFLMVGK